MISRLLSFLKRSQPVVVNCYTSDPSVFEYAQIDKAVKFYPDWWRDIPKDSGSVSMKTCSGFLEQYKKAFILPMWSDVNFRLNEDGSFDWNFAPTFGDHFKADWHPSDQYPDWIQDQSQHVKLVSPWVLHCDEEVYFQVAPVQFSKNKLFDWMALCGVLEFKYQHATHVNMFLNRAQTDTHHIDFGDPLLFLVPLTDRPVIFKSHLVAKDDIRLQVVRPRTYKSAYMLSRKLQKRKESKCPFGFGGE